MSAQAHQVGAHFEALNEPVLFAASKIIEEGFFPCRYHLPDCVSSDGLDIPSTQLLSLVPDETDVRVRLEGQMRDLNRKWSDLKNVAQANANKFERAHEVQRFHRDVEETKDWIQEKHDALNSEEMGKDLRR